MVYDMQQLSPASSTNILSSWYYVQNIQLGPETVYRKGTKKE